MEMDLEERSEFKEVRGILILWMEVVRLWGGKPSEGP